MSKRVFIRESKKKKAVEHVVYEFMMFRRTSEFLLTNIQDQLLKNIVIESFAIHTRNLFEFFYKPKSRDDDIIASDFLLKKHEFRHRKSKKKTLAVVWKKANKQVSHLTYARNNYDKRTKGWNVASIKPKMEMTIRVFLESLDGEDKNWFVREFQKYNIDPLSFP